ARAPKAQANSLCYRKNEGERASQLFPLALNTRTLVLLSSYLSFLSALSAPVPVLAAAPVPVPVEDAAPVLAFVSGFFGSSPQPLIAATNISDATAITIFRMTTLLQPKRNGHPCYGTIH